ncbi:hypothetical protein ACJX0J_015373, partial [Zea mays]
MSECCFQTNNAIITHLIRKGKNKHLQTNINTCLFALLETSSVDDDLSQLKKELSGSSLISAIYLLHMDYNLVTFAVLFTFRIYSFWVLHDMGEPGTAYYKPYLLIEAHFFP